MKLEFSELHEPGYLRERLVHIRYLRVYFVIVINLVLSNMIFP